ncbi:MAG: hypothetical protein B7Y47_16725 [Sphingomonas sp. 28-63-12]|nr:MAG: hypothetical protein B7Y47_16725 [Sphingomonas sp. 28-63-12]
MWLTKPLAMFAVALAIGFLGDVILPRHRPFIGTVAMLMPILLLTATVWWRIWEHDALFAVAYGSALGLTSFGTLMGIILADWVMQARSSKQNRP